MSTIHAGIMAQGEDAEVVAYTSTSLQLIKIPLAVRENIKEATLDTSENSRFMTDTDANFGLQVAKVTFTNHFLQRHYLYDDK